MRTPMTRSHSLLALALGAFALLAGCRIQKPATEVPAPPSIDTFSASATQVAAGTKVTLTWATSNATSVELREASTGDLGVAEGTTSGNVEVTVDAASLYVIVARGPGGTDSRAVSVVVDDAEGEVSFRALPPVINGGASATLVWTAPGATAVSLAAGAQAIDVSGQRTSGAVTVSPRFDTTYTLTVDGRTQTASVTVEPTLLASELSPRAAEVGDDVTLTWQAAGAERVVISSPGRGQLREFTTAADITSGSFTDTVPASPNGGLVTYEIAVVKGSTRVTRLHELTVGTGLAITRVEAPPVAGAGASYRVRWETRAADQVELKVDGVTVHVTATPQAAAVGLFAFIAPMSDFSVEVIATNVQGARDSQLLQVDAVGVPTAATLTANPTTVTLGQPVTLTFASTEARRVRITDAQGEVVFSLTGQPAEGGTATVYPTASTTYTLSADNQLGNPAVTATAAITVTGAAPVVTQYPPTPLSGQIIDIATPAAGALFYGFPHTQVLTASQADFIDISSTGTLVLEAPANVAAINLPFSTVLWGERQSGSLTVSRAGWIAWGASQTVRSANATTLPSTTGPGGMLAPFWDDLTLVAGTSAVYAQLVGNAPNETLIVQWNRLRVGTDAATEVTFQVKVSQRGTVSYQYKTMTLPSAYTSFAVGLQDPTRQSALGTTTASTASSAPTTNSARYFFSPVTSPVSMRVFKGMSWGGYLKEGELFTPVTRPAQAVTLPTDLALTELMFRPSISTGQYLEVVNRTSAPLDLTGWVLRQGTGSFLVPDNFVLQPSVPTVIGASTDAAENDDAGVVLAWGSGFSLARDAGTLVFATFDAGGASVTYSGPSDGGVGSAIQFDPGPFLGTSGSATSTACLTTATFGGQTPAQLGTPGSLAGCGFGYAVVSIPVHFVDVSDGGARLVNSPTTAVDGRTVPIQLAVDGGTDPAPVLFGTRTPVVSMSLDGWMVPSSTTTVDFSNDTNPGTSPLGKLAIFWDDMHTTPSVAGSDMYWKFMAANEDPLTPSAHWVFQWHRIRHYATDPADDLNYEIKLFQDGVIEYHYGTMISGTSDNYADGNSATIWLERLDGSQAQVISLNTPSIRPNTAIRFVPR
jgi:hypothetical protein